MRGCVYFPLITGAIEMNTTTENSSNQVMEMEEMEAVELGKVSGETKGGFVGPRFDGGSGYQWS
jgi:hypothetical protein